MRFCWRSHVLLLLRKPSSACCDWQLSICGVSSEDPLDDIRGYLAHGRMLPFSTIAGA
jgi:hypothetical protein